ncbi:MAG: DUF1634 domain-containing protein [Proteobacteria bacterium]|nr:DUF1634 domain-containing protein [Pseudomonadota bacterium]
MVSEADRPGKPSLLRVELLTANLLRYGVILCTLVIAVGICMSLAAGTQGASHLGSVIQEIISGRLVPALPPLQCFAQSPFWTCLTGPDVVMDLGLALLIALPVARVAMTMVVFAVQKDLVYTVVSAVVLAILLLGLGLGRDF